MGENRDSGRHAALASAVRGRVLGLLETSPLTATELATALGLHVTTARFHLDHLEQAGLVTREAGRERRRGRPSVRYRATAGDPEAAREDLIRVLTEAVAAHGPTVPGEALAAGERWADLLDSPATGAAAAITTAFTRLGFDPEPAGEVIRLRSCPFREAAREHPEVVCQVHLGLARRLAARQPRPAGVGLRPFVEPDLCLITLDEHPEGGGR